METLWMIVAILVITVLFVFAWYAVKKKFRARGRRELGLPPEEHSDALRAGGAVRMPPTSLLLLSREPRPLSRELIADAIRRAWGVEELSDDEADAAHWVFGQTEQLITVSINGTVFTIVSLPEPYKSDRDWYLSDETLPDLAAGWQQHRAWLSVDVAAFGHMVTVQDALDQVGKLLAELADEETLVIVRPAARHAVLFDEELRRLLRVRPAREIVTGTPDSLVILQRERRPIDQLGAKLLAACVKTAWNVELPSVPASPAADFCAVSSENGGAAFIQYHGIRFSIMTPPGLYSRDADDTPEAPALREALGAHQAWCALDLMAAPVGVSKSQVYALLAKLTATLLDDNALLLLAPALHRFFPASRALSDTLRGDDPLNHLLHDLPPA